jgi:hypothetical protein
MAAGRTKIACAITFLTTAAIACDDIRRPSSIIAGPAVPSPIPLTTPYVWDTREQLAVWIDNDVSRGHLELVGDGEGAFIRIAHDDLSWVLRGPDITPAAANARGLTIRYRWQQDSDVAARYASTITLTVYFETTVPDPPPDSQPAAYRSLTPKSDWSILSFSPPPPMALTSGVRYVYLHSYSVNRGVLDIDRIELVQQQSLGRY